MVAADAGVRAAEADLIPTEARQVLRDVASAWDDVADVEAMELVPLKGAGEMAMNKVFEVRWKVDDSGDGEDTRRKVLLRIYGTGGTALLFDRVEDGKGAETVFDREEEIKIFEGLSRHGLGPRLLGKFASGRVEEFLHARTLSAKDLRDPETSGAIAAKLREFHDLDMPGPKKVLLWDRLKYLLKEAKRLSSAQEAKEFCLDMIEEEIISLENELSTEDQRIGFCHNDLWYGNIMMDDETQKVTIIDYELACFNPVAYDIANYFCEMVADYQSETPYVLDFTKYPDFDERKRFVRKYLNSPGDDPKAVEVEILLRNIDKHVLACHIMCGLWALISSHINVKGSEDVVEHARERFRQYRSRKSETSG